MKLLPQYSIRLMLGVTAVAAVVFSVVGLAAREHAWAVGVSVGVAALVVTLATYVTLFGVMWGFSVVVAPVLNRPLRPGKTTLGGTTSPFAASGQAVTENAREATIVEEPGETADVDAGLDGGADRS